MSGALFLLTVLVITFFSLFVGAILEIIKLSDENARLMAICAKAYDDLVGDAPIKRIINGLETAWTESHTAKQMDDDLREYD